MDANVYKNDIIPHNNIVVFILGMTRSIRLSSMEWPEKIYGVAIDSDQYKVLGPEDA